MTETVGETWAPCLETVLERLESLGRARPSHKEILDLYEKILRCRWNWYGGITPKTTHLSGDDEDTGMPEDGCLLDKRAFLCDGAGACEFFLELGEALRRTNERLQEEVPLLLLALNEGKLDWDELLAATVTLDLSLLEKTADRCGVGRDVLELLAFQTVRPFIEKMAREERAAHARSLEELSPGRRTCPVCGSLPVLAELRGEEGVRYLFCSYCATDWRFKRLACPRCGNSEQKTMRYLYFDRPEEKEYTIDLCETCRGYVKTIDSRKTPRLLVPDLEDIASLHLDVIAREDGFQAPSSPFSPFHLQG